MFSQAMKALITLEQVNTCDTMVEKKTLISKTLMVRLTGLGVQPRPQGFSLKKWVGREKALASAGHVYSLNIPEKLIYMQPAGFALTEVERSNNGK